LGKGRLTKGNKTTGSSMSLFTINTTISEWHNRRTAGREKPRCRRLEGGRPGRIGWGGRFVFHSERKRNSGGTARGRWTDGGCQIWRTKRTDVPARGIPCLKKKIPQDKDKQGRDKGSQQTFKVRAPKGERQEAERTHRSDKQLGQSNKAFKRKKSRAHARSSGPSSRLNKKNLSHGSLTRKVGPAMITTGGDRKRARNQEGRRRRSPAEDGRNE